MYNMCMRICVSAVSQNTNAFVLFLNKSPENHEINLLYMYDVCMRVCVSAVSQNTNAFVLFE